MKLQEIAENIAYKLGQQFNHVLKESIKHSLIVYRAKYIRDDIERNGQNINNHFLQYFKVELEEVNLLTIFGANMDCIEGLCDTSEELSEYTILRSTKKIPKPVRLKNAARDLYNFVGTIDGAKRFTYTTLDKFQYVRLLPYTSKTIYYTIIDDYLYILNNLACEDIMDTLVICNALVMGIFEDPRVVYTFCSSEAFVDDNEFPIGADMLMSLEQAILKGEYPLIPVDGEEINLKPEK